MRSRIRPRNAAPPRVENHEFFRPVIIPALLFTIAGVGCSSNDSNDEVLIDDSTAGSPSDNPYQDPDPDGVTAIARAGYAKVRDRANALVSGSYLDGLLAVEDYINTNFVLFEEFENRQFDCPEKRECAGHAVGLRRTTI